jgi:predicted MPP superfamily phosphohydrolase
VVEQEPHYVFVLGNIVFNNAQDEWDVMLKAFEKIECPLYFVGGNHDMNYHYERWFVKYDNQWEAEGRFIDNVGYRYKLIQDDFANYLILNFNDSLPRIESYLEQIEHQIDSTKMTILMSHQNIWKPTLATAKDPHTWPNKTMTGGELLKSLGFVNVFVNGDWNSYFKSETTANASRELTSISAGNKVKGDTAFVSVVNYHHEEIRILNAIGDDTTLEACRNAHTPTVKRVQFLSATKTLKLRSGASGQVYELEISKYTLPSYSYLDSETINAFYL